MDSINHYTLNSKHTNISKSDGVQKEMYFYLKGMIKDAQRKEGVDLMDSTNFLLTLEDDCYVGTLRVKLGNEYIPILVTSGTSNQDKRFYVWKNLIEVRDNVFPSEKAFEIPPTTPFILDLIMPFHINPEIFKWTGDFTKCLGWILMSPKSILK
jgi:hypothetical protein